MTSDRDIFATALQLIKLHGVEGAAFHACQKADEMLAQGAITGVKVWQRIIAAIDVLSDKTPPADRTAH